MFVHGPVGGGSGSGIENELTCVYTAASFHWSGDVFQPKAQPEFFRFAMSKTSTNPSPSISIVRCTPSQ